MYSIVIWFAETGPRVPPCQFMPWPIQTTPDFGSAICMQAWVFYYVICSLAASELQQTTKSPMLAVSYDSDEE